MNKELTVFGTIREAWHLTKGCKWPIIGTALCAYVGILVFILLPIIISAIFFPHTSQQSLISSLIYGVGIFLSVLLMFGMIAGTIKIAIERSRGNAVSVHMGLRALCNRLIPVLLTGIGLVFILTFPALIMLLAQYIPGVIEIILYGIYALLTFIITLLSIPFAVDKTSNPFSAILQSIRATRGHFFALLGILIMLQLIALAIQLPSLLGTLLNSTPLEIIGTIFVLIAMVWLVPFQCLVFGLMYHKLVD